MKILAIASAGGHWIQLLRLVPAFESEEIIFISTKKDLSEVLKSRKLYVVPDANRNNIAKIIHMSYYMIRYMLFIKPDIIISTGAAPGLIGVILGKMLRKKTLWIDSIANVKKVSLSCKLAILFADRVYTQWPLLSNSKIFYKGTVL